MISHQPQRANAIHRCFHSRNVDLLVRAYITYVRPLVEYNSIIWSPHYKQDIERIESVGLQRSFTERLGSGTYYIIIFTVLLECYRLLISLKFTVRVTVVALKLQISFCQDS